MNRLLLGLALVILSSTTFGASHHGVKPVLKFNQESFLQADSVDGGYLKFVEEDVSFFIEGEQKRKFEKAISLLETVMNSEEFKRKVIGYHRTYQRNFLWDDSQKRLTNEDVYRVIMAGNEGSRPNTPGEMNFNSWLKRCTFVERVTTWCRTVIGSTEPYSSAMITFNWKFYSYFETHEMVANMVHEWIHLLGFLHGSDNILEEVPYVVGEIAGEVAKDLLRSSNHYRD